MASPHPAHRRPRPRALLLHGGWEGHEPDRHAAFAERRLLEGLDVTRAQTLDALSDDNLSRFDLLVPMWTFGGLTEPQERALLGAVECGLGLVAWHGAASAFLASRPHKHLLGGQFVGHPGGADTTYQVHFLDNHELVEGLDDVTVTSEQHYLLVDPAVRVLATTPMAAIGMPWLAGVEMPVAWTRMWGAGRVFYCALGHTLDVIEQPTVTTLLRRAVRWAVRPGEAPEELPGKLPGGGGGPRSPQT